MERSEKKREGNEKGDDLRLTMFQKIPNIFFKKKRKKGREPHPPRFYRRDRGSVPDSSRGAGIVLSHHPNDADR